ncbi:hypothetical protein FB45DRAFT_1135460 [Roridomyces roridus]|uniref:U3 small nucleolar RNA-associated protein 10 n=1 Tax=Roridomyces roridus TaxID=1738132 RepID=A0AAD7B1T7_9AGAR|nr:hypothetical protein FB45DRAFT_1135460 [Roridomyces roridus]
MVSSLAAQLAKGASVNTTLLVDRSRRKAAESYLFTGREADQHDLDSIHALAVNAFIQLSALNGNLSRFEGPLFSDASRNTDRTLLSVEEATQLNASIEGFLALLGPLLIDAPTGKILEWLVRRFRINEFNVESLLALFLPYHESPHFAKMLTILHIQQNSTWSFLLPFKSSAQNVPRVALVTEMLKNSDATRFIVNLLPTAIKGNYSHHTILAFNAATIHDYLTRVKALDEGTIAHLLPALLAPLQNRANVTKDAILGSCILLSALSQVCRVTPAALKTIVNAMAASARRVATKQFVNAVVSVCEAQEPLEALTDGTANTILRLPSIQDELRTAERWAGVEKFVCPLLATLFKKMDAENVLSLLESTINSPSAPSAVVRHLVGLLLIKALSEDGHPPTRLLLSQIQQRHPVILKEVADEMSRSHEGVDDLLVSLSAADELQVGGSVVSSMGADERVRTAAVKELLKMLAAPDQEPKVLQSVRAALIARVQDTSTAVLNALYADPSVITPVFLEDPKAYLENLSTAITGAKPKRAFLRLHLTFLAAHFCALATTSALEDVFDKIFFPFLLFSKARQHTAEGDHPAVLRHELLAGCVQIWSAEKGKTEEEEEGSDRLSAMNRAVSAKLAENVMASNSYSAHFSSLTRKMHDADPNVRVLAYLIVRALLVRLSGDHQIEAASQALEAIGLQQLPDLDTSSVESQTLPEFLSDVNLGKMVVSKATSKNTTHWLQMSIATLVLAVPRPSGSILNWFAEESDYVKLLRSAYKLAVSSTTVPVLTVGLLRELFISLKDDALAFLAGFWTTSLGSSPEQHPLCVAALRHAAAFLTAHKDESDGVDFQTILPALIVCLQSPDREIRVAALDCVTLLAGLAEQRFSAVYAFDVIYGESDGGFPSLLPFRPADLSSAKLQYLSQGDIKKYLNDILEHREHLTLDATYLKVFHVQHLARFAADKKKDSEYKRRVLCYLLSHVHVVRLVSARIALLRSIEGIADKARTEVLLPVIVGLIQSDEPLRHDSPEEDFASLVVASFDAASAPDLNDPKGSLWSVFVSVLHHYLRLGTACRTVLLQNLEQWLLGTLSTDRKVEVCNMLLQVGSTDTEMYLPSKKLLAAAFADIPVVIRLLLATRPDASTSPRASKRAKLADVSEDTLSSLGLLAEVLTSIQLPGSLDLVSRLLETLHNVVQSAPTNTDVSYVEQSLMSAVENSAEKIVEVPNISPSAIRLDILVELIRVAENPQTFNQALLLMATLARLAPDSVLHNVMPVFTFMGSNVFHRDDSYSFKVVQRTVESIVPVMVSSLKNAHSNPLDLYIASRDFLRVFTDAANHIPRHRRTSFFGHLADVLGPADFVPPLCMLLVEKIASRVVRQTPEEVQNLLSLPISVLHRYPSTLQTFILTEVLREAQRLTARAADPENLEPALLDNSPDDDQLLPSAATLRRRACALVIFVGFAVKMPSSGAPDVDVPEGATMTTLVSLLIGLVTARGGSTPETKVDDVSQAARSALTRALRCMSAVDFVDALLSILKSGDSPVKVGALDLLSQRIHDISSATRAKITARINETVDEIKKLLLAHLDGALAASGYKAVRSIVETMGPGEENSLLALIPLAISAIRNRKMVKPAVSALAPMSTKLGPRLIPFFRDIVLQSVSLLQDGFEDSETETLSVLNGLLTSIPTFWGPAELTQVSKLYIDRYTSSAVPLLPLMKTVAKRAPTAVLITALADMWPTLKASPNEDRLVGFFDLLKRCLRGGSRPAIQENVRVLFNIFLDAFGLAGLSSPAEDEAISAFTEVVVKLNEASFRPLFRKLYDWAFANETADIQRRITFCNVYAALLDFFKGLMNPYMSFLVQPFADVLKDYTKNKLSDPVLWTGVLDIFTKSLVADDGAFWRDDKLRLAAPALVQQVAVCVRLPNSDAESKTLVTECLVALTDSASEDVLLKAINLDLLMHTRSDDVRVRVFALSCATALWNAHGGKLLAFASETATFIAECGEDEHDTVVREALRLKTAVESVAGNISGL